MLKELDIIAVLPARDMARAFLLYKTDNAGTAKITQMGWRPTISKKA